MPSADDRRDAGDVHGAGGAGSGNLGPVAESHRRHHRHDCPALDRGSGSPGRPDAHQKARPGRTKAHRSACPCRGYQECGFFDRCCAGSVGVGPETGADWCAASAGVAASSDRPAPPRLLLILPRMLHAWRRRTVQVLFGHFAQRSDSWRGQRGACCGTSA